MKRFVLTLAAETHLTEIWDYIASDNPDAATRVLDAFTTAFRLLAESPGVGHYREDLADKRHRFHQIYSYLIVYRWETKPLQIIAIVHTARDVSAVLGSEV
jgi:plasmid stabilization system protein ParE